MGRWADPLRGKSWAERQRIGRLVRSGEVIEDPDDAAIARASYAYLTRNLRLAVTCFWALVAVDCVVALLAALTGNRGNEVALLLVGGLAFCCVALAFNRSLQRTMDRTAVANRWPPVR
jgi:hypothetical protein